MRASALLCLLLTMTNQTFSAIDNRATFSKTERVITVAIIDTGVDTRHRDLRELIWQNPGELGLDQSGRDKSTNGVDDDGNGYVDDQHGWDFARNSRIISDQNGHGTHIAGIIKREFQRTLYKTNRTFSQSVRLMILNYYDPEASDTINLTNTAKAIQYAAAMGADIINYSGGGSLPHRLEYQAIETAAKKGIVFIAAAGNNKSNTDQQKFYPAGYDLNNIITVAATDQQGLLQDFSNYGEQSTDLAAPGAEVRSTLPNNKYGLMSGTSQATAHVTGVAAALLAHKPARSVATLLGQLLEMSDYSRSLQGKIRFPLAMLK